MIIPNKDNIVKNMMILLANFKLLIFYGISILSEFFFSIKLVILAFCFNISSRIERWPIL